MRALIVDDEPIARAVLREELENTAAIEVVGEAEDGAQALDRISALDPDLVFLDLQMPGMGGFEVVARLNNGRLPIVVIVTAYDRYAIEAFEAGALDYLLKPVSQARLARAVERARRLHGQRAEVAEHLRRIQEAASSQIGASNLRKVVGRARDEYFLLNIDEVIAFRAEGDLVWIETSKARYVANETLRGLERRLRDAPFRRVHRSALVNLARVRKMAALTSRRWLLTMDNGDEFTVSKRQVGLIREILEH